MSFSPSTSSARYQGIASSSQTAPARHQGIASSTQASPASFKALTPPLKPLFRHTPLQDEARGEAMVPPYTLESVSPPHRSSPESSQAA